MRKIKDPEPFGAVLALKKFRVSYNVFGELSCNSFFACSDAFIGKGRDAF